MSKGRMSRIWETPRWSLWLHVTGRNSFAAEFKACDRSRTSKGLGARASKFACGRCWPGKIGRESRRRGWGGYGEHTFWKGRRRENGLAMTGCPPGSS